MELQGKIIAVLEPRSGVAKTTGKPFKVAQYILETQEQFPRKVMFEVFGEERISQLNIQMGGLLTVHFDIDAREYNGKWYNTMRAYNVTREAATVQKGADVEDDFPPFGDGQTDVLPF